MAKLKSVTGVEFDPPMPPGRRALAGSKAAQTRSHSIRTSHDLWRALVAVAKRDGHTPSYVITLLVVGDDGILAASLGMVLTDLGCRILGSVATGEMALPLAREHRPDLALMDIELPGKRMFRERELSATVAMDLPRHDKTTRLSGKKTAHPASTGYAV